MTVSGAGSARPSIGKASVRIARRVTQALFLFLFLFLFVRTESTGDNELAYPVRLFLDFDPLLLLSTLLAGHTLKEGFLWALILVGITLLLGRVFCGWICPLGTLNDAAGAFGKKRPAGPSRWHRTKYFILVFLLASSAAGFQAAGILDPLSLLLRSLTTGIQPAFESTARTLFDGLYRLDLPGITALSEALYRVLREQVLSFQQPFFMQGWFMGLLLLAVLALNLLRRRFWCRYLCPLGALLALLSRWSLLKRDISEGCRSCGACSASCPAGAAGEGGHAHPAECLVCLECDRACPDDVPTFVFSATPSRGAAPDLGRRALVASVAGGFAVVPFLRIGPASNPATPSADLIRPPGSRGERDFLGRCVRCGQCMKVCITNGLQPTLLQAGLEGIWTPVLVPRIGPCELRCTLCSQVCPTGAIARVSQKDRETLKIGMAIVDRGRCLPWANGIDCVVCEEVCPTPEKAIHLEEAVWKGLKGPSRTLKRPVIDLERCVGCGACEFHCPVAGKPAIYVISTGESRSPDNQVLL